MRSSTVNLTAHFRKALEKVRATTIEQAAASARAEIDRAEERGRLMAFGEMYLKSVGQYDESKHARDHGKFSSKPGASGTTPKPPPTNIRHNPTLDDFFAEPLAEKPKADDKKIRDNPALDDIFGAGTNEPPKSVPEKRQEVAEAITKPESITPDKLPVLIEALSALSPQELQKVAAVLKQKIGPKPGSTENPIKATRVADGPKPAAGEKVYQARRVNVAKPISVPMKLNQRGKAEQMPVSSDGTMVATKRQRTQHGVSYGGWKPLPYGKLTAKRVKSLAREDAAAAFLYAVESVAEDATQLRFLKSVVAEMGDPLADAFDAADDPESRLTDAADGEGLSHELRHLKAADPDAYEELVESCEDEWSLDRVRKADRGGVVVDLMLWAFFKAIRSHLVRKVGVNKNGKRYVVWVRPPEASHGEVEAGVPLNEEGKRMAAESEAEAKPKTREEVMESRTLLANAVADPNRLNPEQIRDLCGHVDALTKEEAKGLLRVLGEKVGGDQVAVAQRLVAAIRAGREAGKGTGDALQRAGNKTTGQYGAWGAAAGGGEKPVSRDEFLKRGVSAEEKVAGEQSPTHETPQPVAKLDSPAFDYKWAADRIANDLSPFPHSFDYPYTPGDIRNYEKTDAPLADIPVGKLRAVQSDVTGKYVRQLASGQAQPRTAGEPIVVKVGDDYWIDDGTNRAAAEVLKGAATVRARVFEYDPKTGKTAPAEHSQQPAIPPAEHDRRMSQIDPRDSGQVTLPPKMRPPSVDDRDIEARRAAGDKLQRMEGWQADRPSVAADNAVAGAVERVRAAGGGEALGEHEGGTVAVSGGKAGEALQSGSNPEAIRKQSAEPQAWEVDPQRAGESREEWSRRQAKRTPRAKGVRKPTKDEVETLKHYASREAGLHGIRLRFTTASDGSVRIERKGEGGVPADAMTPEQANAVRQILRKYGWADRSTMEHAVPLDHHTRSFSVLMDAGGPHPAFEKEPGPTGSPLTDIRNDRRRGVIGVDTSNVTNAGPVPSSATMTTMKPSGKGEEWEAAAQPTPAHPDDAELSALNRKPFRSLTPAEKKRRDELSRAFAARKNPDATPVMMGGGKGPGVSDSENEGTAPAVTLPPKMKAGGNSQQSPTTGVDKPTTGGNTTPVQPQSAGAKTGGVGMTQEEIKAKAATVDLDELQRVGLVRQQGGKWQYQFKHGTGKWFTAMSQAGALNNGRDAFARFDPETLAAASSGPPQATAATPAPHQSASPPPVSPLGGRKPVAEKPEGRLRKLGFMSKAEAQRVAEKTKVGDVVHDGGKTYVITQVGQPTYASRDDVASGDSVGPAGWSLHLQRHEVERTPEEHATVGKAERVADIQDELKFLNGPADDDRDIAPRRAKAAELEAELKKLQGGAA